MVNRALRHGVKGLRRERGMVTPRCQGKMQLTSALSQQIYLLRIHAPYQFLEKTRRRRCFILKIAFALQHAIIIATESVHRQRPNVAFISDRALQKANNSWLRLCAAIFECSHKCWHVWKIGLVCQKSRDFHIRIHAVFQFPIEFQEKFVVKEHRRVALLRAQNV